MNNSPSHIVLFLVSVIAALLVLALGFVRIAFFNSSPIDLYNIIIAFTIFILIFIAARAMGGKDT